MVSLDGFDLRFLREPDACVFAWATSRAGDGVVTAARKRAAMRRDLLPHHPLRLGRVRAGARVGPAAAVDDEWFVVDLPDGPYEFALVRIAFAGDIATRSDEALLEHSRLALQQMTRLEDAPIFFRCHRGSRPVRDSVDLECRVRLRALDRMLPNLRWRG